MRALTPHSRLHGESGASLAIILALIAILGLCIGAIATQGTAGMLAVKGVSNQRGDVYGAEGAVDGAINYIRNDLTRGRYDTDTCGTTHNDSKPIFKAPSDVGTVTVTCKSLSGSGTEIEGVNYPENAILTTSGLPGYPIIDGGSICSSDPGICVGGTSGGMMKVDGSVKANASSASNQSINASGSTTLNAGSNAVRAAGTCAGNITGAPVKCGTGIARLDPGGVYNSDPTTGGWAPELTSVPPVAPQPSCNTTSKVATMSPGSYFSRDQMLLGFSKVVSGKRISCPVVWMQPGNYYFDLDKATDMDPWRIGFDDAGNTDNLYSDDFTGTDIPGSVIIGGTLSSSINPNASTSQVTAARNAAGSACDRTSATGVQVMMANYTAFDVKDQGILELCPNPNSSKQQIAVYGRKTDQTTSSTTLTFKPTAAGAATPASLGTPFTSLAAIDGSSTSGAQTGNSKTNTVTLTGYTPSSTLSPQQSLSSVTLRVAHQEVTSPSSSSVTITATLTPGDGSAGCSTTFSKRTTLTTDTWTPSCITSVQQLSGASVKWDVKSASSGSPTLTSYLDGIEINATYTPKGLQAKTAGSKIVWMYGDYANHKPQIYIWGTVYAPTSRIELGLAGVATTITRFGRGVVVAGVKVSSLEVNQPFTAFANASGVPWYQDRYIELIAKIGGTRQLRVVLKLTDDDTSTPGKTVQIIAWNAVN